MASLIDFALSILYYAPHGRLRVYFDGAVHDDLTGKLALDPDRVLFSTGGGIVLNLFGIDINLLLNYFINEKLVSLAVGLGVHY